MKKEEVAKGNPRKRIRVRFLDARPMEVPVLLGMGVHREVPELKDFRLVITATNKPI